MDKKNKIFFLVVFLLIIGSIVLTYWRIMIKKDYVIESQIDCDPEEENCFVWRCDPDSTVEGESCTGNAENDVWYYKIARRNAGKVPLCDPEKDENCEPFSCDIEEKDCTEILCDDNNKEDYEAVCNIPAEYLQNNPSEDIVDESKCEEGDVACELEKLPVAEEVICGVDDAECLNSEANISVTPVVQENVPEAE